MRIIRAVTKTAVNYLEKLLVPPRGMERGFFRDCLFEMVSKQRDRLYIVIQIESVEGKEEPEILSFIIATITSNVEYVSILQIWGKPPVQMVDALKTWVENCGKNRIRVEGRSDPELPGLKLQQVFVTFEGSSGLAPLAPDSDETIHEGITPSEKV